MKKLLILIIFVLCAVSVVADPYFAEDNILVNDTFDRANNITMGVAVKGTFPRTIILCSNLHWVALVVLVVGSIALYAKRDVGGVVDAP
jgi:hypothetical protein